VGVGSLWLGRQGSTKHEQPQKVQAFGQSNTLKLFCFGATMAFHIAINNAIFIWEEDGDLHLGMIDHCQIDLSSHTNYIMFFSSMLIIFSSNATRKRM
jgi:hypothetical protein